MQTVEDEMDVSLLNLGMIATYYNISCKSRRRRRKRKDGLTPPLKDVTVEVYTLQGGRHRVRLRYHGNGGRQEE